MNFIRVTPAEMARIRALAAGKKEKRQAKAATLWPKKPLSLAPKKKGKKKTERQLMRDKLDSLWSEAVRRRDLKLYGPLCRICNKNQAVLGYHIVPKQRGDSIRWLLESGCAGCVSCNYGEVTNRSLYRDKHISIFGKELVERLEAKAREHADFSMDDMKRIAAELRGAIGAV